MMMPMYRSLLSALLLGLLPGIEQVSNDALTLTNVAIAPPGEMVEVAEHLSASGVLIMDLRSGQKLFARQERTQRPMASLTKLMTALLIVEHHDLDEVVTVPKSVEDVGGNLAYLPPGERFTVGALLSALLINSANDAAITLAHYHSGSVPAFVAAMNERALALGMTATSFQNPAGFDHPAHWSTPQDIAWLTTFALKQPAIAERMGRAGARIASVEGESIPLYHTHALLHEESTVFAGKTGTTSDAGQCLVSLIAHGGQEYVVVLLGSNQRYSDMETIMTAMHGVDEVAFDE